jgi:oligopeptide/dipeptide ABC transporter ATP-binding protein
MTAPSGAALAVDGLTVVYESVAGAACAVDDVSFAVRKGMVVGLVGESGCGKTTLAMTVGGLIRAPARIASGAVMLAETDDAVTSPDGRVRGRRVAFVPQYSMNALNPVYTVHRQIAEAAALTYASKEVEHRASELLELVGLAPADGAAYPHQLSGGMRQRVVIAMALANTPALLVADEPLTGLDVVTQDKILHLLLDLQARLGVAVLLISHDLPLVGNVVDDLLVMYAGKIVESGPATQVVTSPRHPYTRELLRSFPSLEGPLGELATLPGQPPDPRKLPAGCPFHPRCPVTVSECRELELPLVERGPSHRVACLLEGD